MKVELKNALHGWHEVTWGTDEIRLTQEKDPTWFAEVVTELLSNKKVTAIKVYREHTGLGLRFAKEEIDKFDAELKAFRASYKVTVVKRILLEELI